ncbi:MAG TPA: hypothetical protein VG164_07570 [Trebonia sp.]|nr:hypothetical protein [Trebonia sp.]
MHSERAAGERAETYLRLLAVVDGHLVVAVSGPGFPHARVLALPAPDAGPVRLDVVAAGVSADEALPRWSIR